MRKYFADDMVTTKPESLHRIVYRHDAVTLQQRGKDNFTVRYGKRVEAELTYNEAATVFGAALMHQLACEGTLDNREKNER